jgi:putative addiction module component (TIGR02574 family)
MADQNESIFSDAMSLPPDQRARLADQLLESLAEKIDPAIEEAWAVEIERRMDAYERGETTAISAAEVLQQLRRRKSA